MSMYSGSWETAMESGKDPALPSSEFGGWPPTIPAAHPEFLQAAQNHPLARPVFLRQYCASAQVPINCWPSHNFIRHTSFHCPRPCATVSRYRAVVQPSVLYLHCSICTVSTTKSSAVWPVERLCLFNAVVGFPSFLSVGIWLVAQDIYNQFSILSRCLCFILWLDVKLDFKGRQGIKSKINLLPIILVFLVWIMLTSCS